MNQSLLLNNRYQLEERLGTGGMALVYRARDLMLERSVAIKILRENYSKDPLFRERFRQEARAAANLTHPNIVTVHDFGLDAERLFIVMEYIPGTDLKSILQKNGRFTVDETINLMVQACAGVGYAHRAGLVHCDIKPHNMLISPDMHLKVTDFGIARALASIKPEEKSDVVWGSPQYFSPEQAAGNAPSPASDVYSLGVVMYEMLTGQLPFSSDSATELARLHREALVPQLRKFIPNIPESVEQIVLKVLSKEPSARYRTGDQFGRVLISLAKQASAAAIASPQPIQSIATRQVSLPVPSIPSPAWQNPPNNPIDQYSSTGHSFHSLHSQPVGMHSINRPADPLDIDWVTIWLALATLIAVGGLVPFCMWVYFLYQ